MQFSTYRMVVTASVEDLLEQLTGRISIGVWRVYC